MTGFLLDQFEILADAPGGVQRLRELILQLAVTGRLGTGDETDEDARNTIDVIRKEKKHNSLRKREIISSIGKDILPKLPKKWIWGFIDDIGENEPNAIVDGPFGSNLKISDYCRDGTYPVITISNLDNNFDKKSIRYISENKFIELKRSAVKSNDILIAKIGSSYGKTGVYPDFLSVGIIPANLLKITVNKNINHGYVYLFLNSRFLQSQLDLIVKKTAQPAFGLTNFKGLYIPIPPFAEQERIVEKVDSLMALCDDLEAKQTQKHIHLVKLGTGSLNALQQSTTEEELIRWWGHLQKNFGLIFDCVENVEALRQTILQLAVTGRLGTGDEGDEDASNIGIPKYMDDEENDVQFPKNWTISRFTDIFQFIDYRGKTPIKIESGIPLITAKNVRMGFINPIPREYVSKETYELWMTRGFPQKGDLLFTTEAPLGNIAVMDLDYKFALAQRVINLHPLFSLNSHYLKYAIMSSYMQNKIFEIATGMTAKGVKAAKLKQITVPLPPLAEQSRIVEKVDCIMAFCDKLEEEIEHRSHSAISLSNSIIQQIIGMT